MQRKLVYSRSEALVDLSRPGAWHHELAAAWGVDKSTVENWLKRWRADGLVPREQRIGRCHRFPAVATN